MSKIENSPQKDSSLESSSTFNKPEKSDERSLKLTRLNKYAEWGLDARYLTFNEYKDSSVIMETDQLEKVLAEVPNNVELIALSVCEILFKTIDHMLKNKKFDLDYPIAFWYTGKVVLVILPIANEENLIESEENNLIKIDLNSNNNNFVVGNFRVHYGKEYAWPVKYEHILGINLSSVEDIFKAQSGSYTKYFCNIL